MARHAMVDARAARQQIAFRPQAGRCAARIRGFTLVELITVLVVLGVLAVAVLPRLNDVSDIQAMGFHDEVVSALRHAQKTAVSHRRLVCASFGSGTVTLTVASTNPASGCGAATLNGPKGGSAYATSPDPSAVSASATPAGPIYFQPSGKITNAAGTATDYLVTVSGLTGNTITLVGNTGYVD